MVLLLNSCFPFTFQFPFCIKCVLFPIQNCIINQARAGAWTTYLDLFITQRFIHCFPPKQLTREDPKGVDCDANADELL